MVSQNSNICPCESGQDYDDCCGPFLSREEFPATAEQLMRARYTAYVKEDTGYLKDSWHPDFRPGSISTVPNQKWLGLRIRRAELGGEEDATGIVEFVARFKINGKGHRLHEVSQFVKENGRWLYTEGELKA